ncbi:type VII secretion protein EccCa [Sesbania bispinosa]|nr:type VII secretion protein EccCa [Sesbania bispinosa]
MTACHPHSKDTSDGAPSLKLDFSKGKEGIPTPAMSGIPRCALLNKSKRAYELKAKLEY